MTDEELDNIRYDIRQLQNKKNCIRFNSFAEELKTTGIIMICKILFAILKEVKKWQTKNYVVEKLLRK